jgi:GTP-binding protein LepA
VKNIRNFSIIAHIDHGKSTLADRMLEMTGTIQARDMQDQFLDRMDLERERGITIKMQPVRMAWKYKNEDYILNLIDTPGHVDFAYEVSRALTAVEGVVLLVDSTQGVEAQTLSVLAIARSLNLKIIPVVSKIDAPHARVEDIVSEIALLIGCEEEDVMKVSGKTGAGVAELLNAIVDIVPEPTAGIDKAQALIFDFGYSDHRGVIVYMRVFGGTFSKGDAMRLIAGNADFNALEVGIMAPQESPRESLTAGEIGYVVTGIKKPGIASVGDTLTLARHPGPAFAGYQAPTPVIWASVYPESQDDLHELRQALEKLRLTDSSLSYEEEASGVMGKGFRCGFLGMLHLEIVVERLHREFDMELVVTMPTTVYEVTHLNGEIEEIYAPSRFPDDNQYKSIREMWTRISIMTPPEYVGAISQLIYEHEAALGDAETLPDGKVRMSADMPLRELMRGFFDRLKSISSGYASLGYEMIGMRAAEVTRLDVLIAEEVNPAFARIVSSRRVDHDAEAIVVKLADILPRQLFDLKIQAKAHGKIIASRKLSAMRKDVTAKLYGGDVSRKNKLLDKQKKGKKKMLARGVGSVDISHDVFLKIIREA